MAKSKTAKNEEVKSEAVYWPRNTMAYYTLTQIRATMPKLGTGKIRMSKPTKPNGKKSPKKS